MMRGEFESCAAIHNAVPTFCARPIGWGAFKSKPNTYYNLSHFHERVSPPRDPAAFAALLARLHTRAKPPADNHHHHQRFGFPVATFVGGEVLNEPIAADTWEEAFTLGLKQMLALDDEINGVDEALVALREELIARVIPRLLRPLRGITPALCHGYLCAANAGVTEDGDTMVWRPAALFAHNEFELGMWRAVANGFDGRFVRAYLKLVPISEPAEDFEMRNALYALRHTVAASIRFPGSDKYRLAVRDEIAALVGRFSPGPEWPLRLEENEDVVVELEAEGVTVLVAAGTVANRVVRPAGTRVKSKSIVGGKLVKR
jgi:protein-ribulosamine 3-kinase